MSFPISMLRGLSAGSNASDRPASIAQRASTWQPGRAMHAADPAASVERVATDEPGTNTSTASVIRSQEGAMATKQAFLTLLVAQIKNQNPLNPTDGTEFLSQLAQFSELEQLISIREELEAMGGRNPTPEGGS